MKNILGYLLLVVLLGAFSYGNDLDDANDAFQRQDYQTAFQLMNRACDNGEAIGCNNVAYFLENGFGTQKNIQLALEYYLKACNMGDTDTCETYKKLQNTIPVCSEDELSFLNDKRYFFVASSDMNPAIVADAQTIRIDRKNKVIQVWITWIANQKNRDSWIQIYGQSYNNFGHYKDLEFINYGNMTNKSNTTTFYNCDGSSIETSGAVGWNSIIPGSVMESITQAIMKKYGLK